MWKLWLKHRWREASAVVVALLAVLLVVVVATGRDRHVLSLLGDAAALRAAAIGAPAGVTLPRSTDPDALIPQAPDASGPGSALDRVRATASSPETVAAAQAAWPAAEVRRRQSEVLAAINCAREAGGKPALTLDAALSDTAGQAWLALVRDPAWSLMDLPGEYALRSVMALDFGSPAADASGEALADPGQERACGVGGFDPAMLPAAQEARRIGVAVFPPQASWDAASAVVLVK